MTSRSNVYFILAGIGCVLLAVIFATRAQPAALTSPLALRQGELRQETRNVEFTVRTARRVDLGTLDPLPDVDNGKSRYLCLELERIEGESAARICLGPGDEVGVTPTKGDAEPGKLEAEVLQPDPGVNTVRVPFGRLDLSPGKYRFRFVSSDGSCGAEPGDGCVDAIPDGDGADFNLRVPALVKCEGATGQEVRNGSRDEAKVALTFDDGPGASTRDILRILRQKRVDATFYLLGAMISQDEEAVKQIPRQGSEVANHSTSHDARPPQADLENTNELIREATGVTPCTFRPPYGEVDANVVAGAKAAGLDTILWDVDTQDWQSTSTVDSIVENVRENSENGSIILMHDGGDSPRPKTVEVLPKLIDMLRDEGYAFVTVSELLGNDITWKPLGKP